MRIMKSNHLQLSGRGFINKENIEFYRNNNIEDLLTSANPVERTVGYLMVRYDKNNNYLDLLIKNLRKENALYSKLELCKTICNFEELIPVLIRLTGKIGKNQLKKVPSAVFRKKSYPLPRDIVARILIRMTPEKVIERIIKTINEETDFSINELIDVVGYISFYNEADRQFESIWDSINKYLKSDLTRYKIAFLLRGFSNKKAEEVLKDVIQHENHPIIKKELIITLKYITRKNMSV